MIGDATLFQRADNIEPAGARFSRFSMPGRIIAIGISQLQCRAQWPGLRRMNC